AKGVARKGGEGGILFHRTIAPGRADRARSADDLELRLGGGEQEGTPCIGGSAPALERGGAGAQRLHEGGPFKARPFLGKEPGRLAHASDRKSRLPARTQCHRYAEILVVRHSRYSRALKRASGPAV